MSLPLHELTLAQAGESVRRREVTALALTEAALARAEDVQPKINCFLRIDKESALEAADQADAEIAAGNWRGPLHDQPRHRDVAVRRGRGNLPGRPQSR